ncbi:hypothetical protein L211DRAFT_562623 [Terfezia boudieri ATCC MYA-4762]|uniref:REJ domain-containing protein n=1 Tax=Terfezia boudieri ATCC MYA-4762 TaxID=1051890 RepID=A0A3N4LXQ6_9PEZI|nr:hypothetical protein L211DRAFT_562623 [Terfezia boudieri ATCC MYA-4762]
MVQPSKLSLSGGTSRQQVVASSSTREPPATTLGGFARAENLPTQERDDSWIEVSSQPDDTYSSADEILSDGLNLNPTSRGSNIRQRKRKLRRNEILLGRTETNKAYDHSADDLSEVEMVEGSLSSGPGSSIGELPQQEDFESSSSAAGEEDEGTSSEEGEIEGEEEDTGTMLGVGYRNDERPHHHHHHHHHHHQRVQGRYSTHSVSEFHRTLESHNPSHSFLRHRNSHSGGSSGRQLHPHPFSETKEHHDEVLMASLSTLLSCAAAARGLPKVSQQQGASSPGGGLSRVPTMSSSRVQLDTLHLVPDQVMSEAHKPFAAAGETTSSPKENTTTTGITTTWAAISADHSTRSRGPISLSPTNTSSRDSSKKPATTTTSKKRSSSTSKPRTRSSSPRRRTSRLTSTLSTTDASLLTLAVSAGAVIILSAISFSAGYVLGKEVGKMEWSVLVLRR